MDRSPAPKTVKPVQTYRLHGVSVSIFQNATEDGASSYFKVALQRTYRLDNEWKTTQSLSRDDLPIAALLLQQAWEYILQAEASDGSQESSD